MSVAAGVVLIALVALRHRVAEDETDDPAAAAEDAPGTFVTFETDLEVVVPAHLTLGVSR